MTGPETGKTGKGRATIPVRRSVEQRLLAYAAAASASLVTVQPAAAKVIYTPINLTIETGTVPLDLNHDGVVDFNVVQWFFVDTTFRLDGEGSLNINGAGNPGAGVVGNRYGASALVLGAEIGPGKPFLSVQNNGAKMVFASQRYLTSYYLHCSGAFSGGNGYCKGVADRFLGLRFEISGRTYFGWAGFSVVKISFNPNGKPYIHARLVGVAYEDSPGQPILARELQDSTAMIETAPNPQPATLGLLALGAPGLDIWRRREAS